MLQLSCKVEREGVPPKMSLEDVALRLCLGAVQMFMSGIHLWQWVTSSPDRGRPRLKQVFVAFAGLTFTTGLYLIVSTVTG